MTISKKVLAGGLAALAMMVTTAGAFAAPAYATSYLNVRSGPGTNFRVVDTLRRGERVDVEYCRGSWCFIKKSGRDGWASANYLDRGRRDYRPPVVQPPGWDRHRPPHWRHDHDRDWRHDRDRDRDWRHDRDRGPSADFCFNGPNGYFCFGN